jgi:selenocysteine lyase/cysteine desulfurase
VASPWDEIRRDFPAVTRHVYLNAAAAGPTPRPVREAVTEFLREMEEDGDLYWESWIEHRESVRARVAAFVGAEADEIAFVPNTSTGMNLIVDLLGEDGAVLSHELEFPAVTLPWIHRGIPVHLLPAVEGLVRLESFSLAGAPRAATIAISHVEFSNGCRQDLEAFGRLKAHRSLVVSGSQAVGAFPVDVRRCRIDALACAGHKWLCAGYGAGFLYVSRELLARRAPRMVGWLSVERPFSFDNRQVRLLSSARRHELGCPSFAPIFALGAAVEYLAGIGIEAIAARVLELNLYLTFRLQRAGFEVLSPGGEHRSGQTLVALPQPRGAAEFLQERGILVTRKREGVRISTHFFNNEEDIEACVNALVEQRSAPAAGH